MHLLGQIFCFRKLLRFDCNLLESAGLNLSSGLEPFHFFSNVTKFRICKLLFTCPWI
jgi:hypothetical protein